MAKIWAGLAVLGMLVAAPSLAHAATVVAHVDVAKQVMTVSRQGKVLYTWKVSTARKGYDTPLGTWRPYRIHQLWKSRKYDDAPMPYAVFYDRGWAVHGTTAVSRLGRPASHGCVRLATSNAKAFYDLVREVGPGNTRIIVAN
ncbi:L,D-transpeptidase [Tianweitania populi]|uniref:L,D-transpeptidase n=1 Tax=Tianweitania populi TaxID=1607949 RepID=A0A8J3DVN5_9HYPH|nr:L,D-transpeptidase [Tianweitania populi]GHD10377.1 L,D-transpeptidase [Tianweitania populi]